jgi:hypothetical protein
MTTITLRNVLLPLMISIGLVSGLHAQHEDIARPEAWKGLGFGGRFMDRFEPMPLLENRTGNTWGEDGVKPRDILNGIEEAAWSYWGGNIVQGRDQAYHLFVCRWREDHPKGHMAWRGSEVVRAVSKDRLGPYKVAEVIGLGHNPEVYRLTDGRYVCYVINAYYLGQTIAGPWERKTFEFDARDRKIVAGLSNLSFSLREDGSCLMVNRGGGMWVSRDGLSAWQQVTQGSNYPQVKGRFEDPVLWRTEVQYHMIVNDWHGRIAYHLRSKNGVHWKVDAGEAYMPGIAVSEDGKQDEWYKYERIKMLQDERRRAIQANFAVIDYNKWEDKPNDIHSSKNISIPLTAGRLVTLLNRERITQYTMEVKIRIAAEPDFDPHRDIQLNSLRFGAPEEVDFDRGARLTRTVKDGKDLIAVFGGRGNGFADHSFTGKLLGRTSQGKLLFGYCRLPWVTYIEPILTVRRPQVVRQAGKRVLRIEVSNHGQVASKASTIQIESVDMPPITAPCPAVEPYSKTTVDVTLPTAFKSGKNYDLTVTTGMYLQQPTVFTAQKIKIDPARN